MRTLFVAAGLAMALTGCASSENHWLITLPDGSEGYSIRTNSPPFQVGRMSEADVLRDYMAYRRLCPGGYDIVNVHRLFPENYSVVMVDAVVKCRPDIARP